MDLLTSMPYVVADMSPSMVAFGRKEMEIALGEMPGLLALRQRYAGQKPLAGERVMGSLHMTIQTAVLIETLVLLGAEVRWASCNIYSTQDHAAAAVAAGVVGSEELTGVSVFAWKGETLEEYWWCTLQALAFSGGERGPSLIVDDGGDATLLLHLGVEYEDSGVIPDVSTAESAEHAEILKLLHRVRAERGDRFFHGLIEGIKGVSEETTTGVHRLYQRARAGKLLFPAINVNDAVTKSKFDNLYGCRHSLGDAIMRATDRMISGLRVLVCGFGDVGKGCVQSMRAQQARVAITEIDPICALQAAMQGVDVITVEDALDRGFDIYVTATGNRDIITAAHMQRMKHMAIVCNIGHFDNEIDMAGLEALKREGLVEEIEIKPNVHEWRFKATDHQPAHSIIVLAQGRLVNLGCATGHPNFVMSNSFTNQVLAQLDLAGNGESYENEVYTLPKALDEEVARLHISYFGAKLTVLTPVQAKYIDVDIAGPYKDDQYRY